MSGSPASRRAALLRSLGRTGKARLRDLAEELDVSMPTVRRDVEALSRQGRLTRRHGAVELEDRSRLPRESGGAIGMMVSTNRYLALIGQAVRREAERRGHRFLLEHVEDAEESRAATARLVAAGCVGLVCSPQWRTEEEAAEPLPWLAGAAVPVVLAGRDVEAGHPLFELDSVIADHAYGMRLAMDHLQQLGHTRILASIRDNTPPGRLLRRFFVAELHRRGLPQLGEPLLTPEGLEPADFDAVVAAVLDQRATVVVMHTDTSAQVLVSALRARGVDVPGRCSVVAYDDIVGPRAEVSLTSISPAKHQLGVEAVSLLLRRHLRARAGLDRPPVAHVRLLPELVLRRSTGPVPTRF
ncbi:LacI family DNA-binding transcriptional regulator [Microlunatus capsulatus]|uniref:LacI family DNA-binding transcriptional regulator n=1 Tax=Microlunatus capsulatus TaxID=99117 RepID=UPI0031DC7A7D